MKKAAVVILLTATALFSFFGCRGGFFSGMPGDLKKVKNVQDKR